MTEGAERQILAMVVPFGMPNRRNGKAYGPRDFTAFVVAEKTAPIYHHHGEYDLGRYAPGTSVGVFRHFAIAAASPDWPDSGHPAGLVGLGDFYRSPGGEQFLSFARTPMYAERPWMVSAGLGEPDADGEKVEEVSLTPSGAFEMAHIIAIGERAGPLWTSMTGLTAPVPPMPTAEVTVGRRLIGATTTGRPIYANETWKV